MDLFVFFIWLFTILTVKGLSTLFGWSDSMHFYYKYNGKAEPVFGLEHEVWTAIRLLAFAPIWYIWLTTFGLIGIIGIASTFMIFPFFHDGMYYKKRDAYDGSYPIGWSDMTKSKRLSSTIVLDVKLTFKDKVIKFIEENRLSFTWKLRLILFILGTIGFILMLLLPF